MSNSNLAKAVIEQALAWEVRDFVVCAGARNAPVVLPLLGAPDPVRVWNHFDERSAAFFALGLSKRDSRPVAVVTTSGTAVAELLPATIEAHYSGIPLVLITADRPKRFRGTGAPQSILQPGLFGEHVDGCFDCESPEELPAGFPWNRGRPIQLNPCFEEPGVDSPAEIDWQNASRASGEVKSIQPCSFGDPTLLTRFVADFEGGVVLLGEIGANRRESVANFLKKLGAPVWAEAISGLRESPELEGLLIRGGDPAFDGLEQTPWPMKVLRIGGVPSLRFWRDLEERREIAVMSVTPTGFSGLARDSEVLQLDLGEIGGAEVADSSVVVSKQPVGKLDALLEEYPHSEPALMRKLSEQIPSEARVFLGNSLPIREWNLAAATEIPHSDCFANRGANGIDGEISTFLGLSEGAVESWGIFGDLTALYDLNAPWMLKQLSEGRRRIVVINNGGGRIFSRLRGLGDLDEEKKIRTENRHDVSFEAQAAMWGKMYRLSHDGKELDSISRRHTLIELRPDDAETEAFWREFSS